MNKYLLLFLLPLLSFTLTGCDDDEDAKPMDLRLFAGTWDVVDQGNQEVFNKGSILEITSSEINEGFGGYQGYMTTYLQPVGGAPVHDRVFTWAIREVENHKPLLDVVLEGELDSEDIWAGDYYYRITGLDRNEMQWQVNTNGDNSIIRFRRHSDISPD